MVICTKTEARFITAFYTVTVHDSQAQTVRHHTQTQIVRHQTSDTDCQISDIRHGLSVIRHQTRTDRHQTLHRDCQTSDTDIDIDIRHIYRHRRQKQIQTQTSDTDGPAYISVQIDSPRINDVHLKEHRQHLPDILNSKCMKVQTADTEERVIIFGEVAGILMYDCLEHLRVLDIQILPSKYAHLSETVIANSI